MLDSDLSDYSDCASHSTLNNWLDMLGHCWPRLNMKQIN